MKMEWKIYAEQNRLEKLVLYIRRYCINWIIIIYHRIIVFVSILFLFGDVVEKNCDNTRNRQCTPETSGFAYTFLTRELVRNRVVGTADRRKKKE